MTPFISLLTSPRLSACLRSLSVSSPARELSCLLDMISGPGLRRIARFGFTLQSLEESCVPLLSSGGQMKSQLELTTGMRGHIFSTDLHLTVCFLPALAIKGH